MPAKQLKETTMDPAKRTLLRVTIAADGDQNPGTEQKKAADLVEQLMGRKPEMRFAFRSEEHTSELQSLMRTSYAVFCLKKKLNKKTTNIHLQPHTKHKKIQHSKK